MTFILRESAHYFTSTKLEVLVLFLLRDPYASRVVLNNAAGLSQQWGQTIGFHDTLRWEILAALNFLHQDVVQASVACK